MCTHMRVTHRSPLQEVDKTAWGHGASVAAGPTGLSSWAWPLQSTITGGMWSLHMAAQDDGSQV